jgi:uncharacterized protein YecE (DUF72 family)
MNQSGSNESTKRTMSFHIGIGSWADAAYKNILTAPDVSAKDRLKAYTRWFNHVEVNSTYYATPRAESVAGWVKETPPGFTFNIKLHRAFSQNPHKAATEGELVGKLLEGVNPLVRADKFGTFLLVLEPSFTPKNHALTELDPLVEKLRPHALAVELRHSDWVTGSQREQTLGYFRDNSLVWVAVDMPVIQGSTLMPVLDEITRSDLAYLRLHGRNPDYLKAKSAAERHVYEYSSSELTSIAKRVTALAEKATRVHVIANNHAEDFAPKTALTLKQLLEPRA